MLGHPFEWIYELVLKVAPCLHTLEFKDWVTAESHVIHLQMNHSIGTDWTDCQPSNKFCRFEENPVNIFNCCLKNLHETFTWKVSGSIKFPTSFRGTSWLLCKCKFCIVINRLVNKRASSSLMLLESCENFESKHFCVIKILGHHVEFLEFL